MIPPMERWPELWPIYYGGTCIWLIVIGLFVLTVFGKLPRLTIPAGYSPAEWRRKTGRAVIAALGGLVIFAVHSRTARWPEMRALSQATTLFVLAPSLVVLLIVRHWFNAQREGGA